MSEQGALPPAGWYPDPQGPGNERWFDGQSWTTGVRPVPAPVPAPAPTPVWETPQPTPVPAPAWETPQPATPDSSAQPYQPPTPQQPAQPYLGQPYQQPMHQPVQQPWQQPQKQGMSTGAKVAIALGSVVGAFVLLGIIAAVAIPVFLNQRDKAAVGDLAALTCQDLAGQVALDSVDQPTDDGHWIVEVADVWLVEDARDQVVPPTGADEAFVLTCAGTAVWDDQLEEPVQIDLYVDSRMDRVYYLFWGE